MLILILTHVSTFLSTMFQNNFQSSITEPTRISNTNKPSLVDNIFINTFDSPVCGNILEHISYDRLPHFPMLKHTLKRKILEKYSIWGIIILVRSILGRFVVCHYKIHHAEWICIMMTNFFQVFKLFFIHDERISSVHFQSF